MSNEQQELLDEAYFKRYRLEAWGECDRSWLLELDGINLTTGKKGKVHRQLTQEEFIDKCKTNPEFSEKWGLKIEERELSEEERWRIRFDYYPKDKQFPWDRMALPSHRFLDDFNIPRRVITITYNDKTIESYE